MYYRDDTLKAIQNTACVTGRTWEFTFDCTACFYNISRTSTLQSTCVITKIQYIANNKEMIVSFINYTKGMVLHNSLYKFY